MRLFIASPLGDAVRSAMAEGLSAMLSACPQLRTVPAGSEHLTHAFLGERETDVSELLDAFEPIAQIPSIPIRLGRPRVLGPRARPRLVLLEVLVGAEEVARLTAVVRERLSGLFPDLARERAKAPHVTVARFRRGAGRREREDVERRLEGTGFTERVFDDIVGRVDLMKSELGRGGPRYTRLGGIELA